MRIRIPYWHHVKKYLPKTLFWRSFMIIVLPAMLLQMILCFIFLDKHWSAMGERLAAAVAGETSVIITQFKKLNNTMPLKEVQDRLNEMANATGMHIFYQPNGKLPMQHDKIGRWLNMTPFITHELHKKIDYNFAVTKHSRQKRWVQLRIDLGNAGLLIIEMPERRLFSSTSYIFVLWLLGSSFILFTIALLFMRNQIRPILRLSEAVELFGRGEDAPNFRPEGALEVKQAGVLFIKMRERIRRQIEQRTAMLAGISHDLRTPVTRMKIEVEMLEDKQSAEGLKSDLHAMEEMLNGYLSFAQGEQDEESQNIDLGQLLKNLVGDAKRQGYTVKYNQEECPFIEIRGKYIALYRAINNIISNGCKYGESVSISFYKVKNDQNMDMVEIRIDDNGSGIPEESIKDVFKPFFRLEKSRNPETGGVGLGLSIAQDIINAHGGRISLEKLEQRQQGLRVLIRLPL